ncbi:hypothetical protein CFAM422_003319 [Trichoderma lentiforme]|uniref:Uncharacterized protein n=1 Tax=Trichoderma lentiforme TaxID=1567552 RepID=A0A9P4XI21_9HYPO|nr:hypothetical protein CFAM422_003319 [Trichoderma lentiforme]
MPTQMLSSAGFSILTARGFGWVGPHILIELGASGIWPNQRLPKVQPTTSLEEENLSVVLFLATRKQGGEFSVRAVAVRSG